MSVPPRRVRFESGRVVVSSLPLPSVVRVPAPGRGVAGSQAPAHSQAPPHGQGLGLGLAILSTGSASAGASSQLDNYALTVLSDSPAAYWRLGEASGTVVHDSSGNGLNGTYVNSPPLGQTGIPGAIGNTAASFDNPVGPANPYSAQFGDILPLTGTKLSIEFWLKHGSTGNGAFCAFLCRGDVTWRVGVGSAGQGTLQFAVGSGSTPSTSITDARLSDTTAFHHVVCVYDQTNLLIYLDGAVAGTKPWTTDVPAAAGKNVAISFNSDAAARYIHDFMDEVAVYSHALTAGRVSAHYVAGTT